MMFFMVEGLASYKRYHTKVEDSCLRLTQIRLSFSYPGVADHLPPNRIAGNNKI